MAFVGAHCERGFISIERCIECPSRCIVLPVIQDQMDKRSIGYYASRKSEVHVTSLLGCPRKTVMGELYGEYVTPRSFWRMQSGTMCHALMERYPRGNGIAEKMVEMDYFASGGMRFHVVGRFDWYDYSDKMIHDYKFVWSDRYIPNTKHYKQTALYYIVGTDSCVFHPEDIEGCCIEYVDARSGQNMNFVVKGGEFMKFVAVMKKHMAIMLDAYEQASKGVLCDGDPEQDECNYCPADFKECCSAGDSVRDVGIVVDAYRRSNTSKEE